jgi:Flp pilus assembly pilin Flp
MASSSKPRGGGLKPSATPNHAKIIAQGETKDMSAITKLVVRVREFNRGQTMAEYALIMAAVAVVVFVGYQTMGTTITTLLGSVDGKL